MPQALDVEELRRLYSLGLTIERVGKILGRSRSSIQQHLKRNGIAVRPSCGCNHGFWKGNSASYDAFHARLRKAKGQPQSCDECKTCDPSKTYEWANLTGNYSDLEDYKRLCRGCHRRYDHGRRILQTHDIDFVRFYRERGFGAPRLAKAFNTTEKKMYVYLKYMEALQTCQN